MSTRHAKGAVAAAIAAIGVSGCGSSGGVTWISAHAAGVAPSAAPTTAAVATQPRAHHSRARRQTGGSGSYSF